MLTLSDAIKKLAPSRSVQAKTNVLRLRPGHFVGLTGGRDATNFVIVNPTRDGDIRWLLKRNAEFASVVKEIYKVEEVRIPKTVVDVPGDAERS